MSGKEFFLRRYEKLGWEYKDTEPRQAIRTNRMNAKETDVAKRLKSLGIELEEISFLENGYWISRSRFSVGATAEYLLGMYSIQEAAAQIPATLFNSIADKTVLDACAAPGGKTVQLADLMKNTGAIIALDVERRRLAALANQLERCRVSNAVIYDLDARLISRRKLEFDRILLDVPCSGNFTMDRHWFERRSLGDIKRNAQLQREILSETVKTLKDEGEIVYATCSLEPEEDELNIDWAASHLGLQIDTIHCHGRKGLTEVFGKQLDPTVERCRRIWPGETQGFFVCRLRKRERA